MTKQKPYVSLRLLYTIFNTGDFNAYRGMVRVGFTMLDWPVKLKNQN